MMVLVTVNGSTPHPDRSYLSGKLNLIPQQLTRRRCHHFIVMPDRRSHRFAIIWKDYQGLGGSTPLLYDDTTEICTSIDPWPRRELLA